MTSKIVRLRLAAANKQRGLCWYCEVPMRADGPLMCTAEHLLPRSEGGRDERDNIVAACRYCNRHRHRRRAQLEPAAHRERVRGRLSAGRWNAHLRAPRTRHSQ